MGDHQSLDFLESEEISDSFVCCVCLDLLYKPIVLSCGHISCFWCVQKSMNAVRESHCPICRNPYSHFPTICQMLHFLLQKMYPIAYKRRELQILEEEKTMDLFSPQFDANVSLAKQESHLLGNSAHGESCVNVEQLEPISKVQDSLMSIPEKAPDGNHEMDWTLADNIKNSPRDQHSGNGKQVMVEDVLCVRCKELLFRPVVLNCGHVYCESCLIDLCDEVIRCQACQSTHPKGLPKVSLELSHFLEDLFPKEYALRRDAVQIKRVNCQQESLVTSLAEAGNKVKNAHRWSDTHSKTHFGVGCDYCGIFPITGDRYRCKDCVERVGFDLCGDCYNSSSKLPGRFNQQHTPEHNFELIQPHIIPNRMLRLVTSRVEEGSATLVIDNYSPENLEDGSLENSEDGSTLFLSGGAQDNVENNSAAPEAPGGGEDEADSQPPT